MVNSVTESVDFFISHRRGKGAGYAAEVRQVLVEAGFSVVSQHPDIAYGDNFVIRIHQFLKSARDLIVILTEDYDQSQYTLLEFSSFMAATLHGREPRRLLVFRVENVDPPGLLAGFTYVDLSRSREPGERSKLIIAAARNDTYLDFTTARRAVQTVLRHRELREVRGESSQLEALVRTATQTRLRSLDSHVSSVATDFGASIREFLSLYTGVGATKDIFGGRECDLDQLTDWVRSPSANPYQLITGSAGRGKSMLLVRWALDVVGTSGLDVVFIPISIRCQTNTATVVLQALVTRLAILFDQDTLQLIGLPPEVLCDLARGYLQRERDDGRTTLVILDGLDEAVDKEMFRGLLPSNPPKSLRILLSARPQAAMDGIQDEWRIQLGFGQLAPTARRNLLCIKSLERMGLAAVESTVADALAGLANDKIIERVTVELFRLCEGEPFVLTLYLHRIVEREAPLDVSIVDRLSNLEPGISACFNDWWQQQLLLWKKTGVNEDTIVSVLATLSTSHGPMSIDEIQAVNGNHLSGYTVRLALRHLHRFVVVTACEERFTIFHERLADFVRTILMSEAEVEAMRSRFLDWGLAEASHYVRSAPSSRLLPPQYVLRHLGLHLHGKEVALGRLKPLLAKVWADLWLARDGHYGGFIAATCYVLKSCLKHYRASNDAPERQKAFLLAVEAVLARSSAISVAESLPPRLLRLLLQERVWTGNQALAYVRAVHKSQKKLAALCEIAGILDSEYHAAFLEMAVAMGEDNAAFTALEAITAHVSGSNAKAYIEIVARYPEPIDRALLLRALDCSQDAEIRNSVLNLLSETRAVADQNYEFAGLALTQRMHADLGQQAFLFDEAVHYATITEDEAGFPVLHKVETLCRLADICVIPDSSRLLALEALNRLTPWNLAFFESITFVKCSQTFSKWIFPEALVKARQFDKLMNVMNEDENTYALIAELDLSRWPDEAATVELLLQATIGAAEESDWYDFLPKMKRLQKHLSGDRLDAFKVAIEQVPARNGDYWKAQVLLLNLLSGDCQLQLARHLFAQINSFAEEAWSAELLSEVAVFLPSGVRKEAVQTTLLVSRAIHDKYKCVRSIAKLAGYTSDSSAPFSDSVLRVLLEDRRTFLSALSNPHFLISRPQGISEALRAMDGYADYDMARGLVIMARFVTNESTLEQYRACARTIESPWRYTEVIFALLGISALREIEFDILCSWLREAEFRSTHREPLLLPPQLNVTQIDFLADRLATISDLAVRVFVGSKIVPELRRRDIWDRYHADLIDYFDSTQDRRFDIDQCLKQCDFHEIAPIMARAERCGEYVYRQVLFCALEKAPIGDHLDDVASRLVAQVRNTIAVAKPNWLESGGLHDILEKVLRRPVSESVAFDVLKVSTDLGWKEDEIRRLMVRRLDELKLTEYVDRSRACLMSSTWIQNIAPIFSRIPAELRDRLFIEMTEWMEAHYCDGQATQDYMRMSEHCHSDPHVVARLGLSKLRQSTDIGASVTEIEGFLVIISSWSESGRIDEKAARFWLSELLLEITAHDRGDVLEILDGMDSAILTLDGIPAAEIADRIVNVCSEWL